MACFLVPTAEAIVVSAVTAKAPAKETTEQTDGLTWSRKIGWLKNMLWGGAILLLLEHMWHGEVVPWPPFLTAMLNPADTAAMLQEMATVGVGMAVLVTAAWGIMVLVSTHVPAVRRMLVGEGA